MAENNLSFPQTLQNYL